jgi:hypothetical protein
VPEAVLENIERNARAQKRLVSDLLDMSSIVSVVAAGTRSV